MDDKRDTRRGAYDPVNRAGLPQPDQSGELRSEHEDAQSGADVRSEPLPSHEEALPEGLRRERKGPLYDRRDKDDGTRTTDGEPTDEEMAQKQREKMHRRQKAHGEEQ